MTRFSSVCFTVVLTLLAGVLVLGLAGCSAGKSFSTASPDVPIDKSQDQLTGDNLTVQVPDEVTFNFAGDPPKTIEGDLTVGVFTQRHNADSDTGLESTLENAVKLRDVLNPSAQANVSATGQGAATTDGGGANSGESSASDE